MAGPGDLHALAVSFLDVCVDALDTIPILAPAQGLIGAPGRAFVSPGLPVWDCCEQIAVWVTPMTEADTTPGGLDAGRRAARFARINHVGLNAQVTRCIPEAAQGTDTMTGSYTPPEAAAMTEAAKQVNADGWALSNHLFNATNAEHLLTLCDEVFFDSIAAVFPAGGCAGWQVSARASLGGYTELLGS